MNISITQKSFMQEMSEQCVISRMCNIKPDLMVKVPYLIYRSSHNRSNWQTHVLNQRKRRQNNV